MQSEKTSMSAPVDAVVILPEWDKLKRQGWRFVYDSHTRFLGCEHENGKGKFSIARFEVQAGDRETLAHQIGHTVALFLND